MTAPIPGRTDIPIMLPIMMIEMENKMKAFLLTKKMFKNI